MESARVTVLCFSQWEPVIVFIAVEYVIHHGNKSKHATHSYMYIQKQTMRVLKVATSVKNSKQDTLNHNVARVG